MNNANWIIIFITNNIKVVSVVEYFKNELGNNGILFL